MKNSKDLMKTSFKFTHALVILFIMTMMTFSCSEEEMMEELPPLLIDCSDLIQEGESFNLEDRNSDVDYIIDCNYRVWGGLVVDPSVVIEFRSNAAISILEPGFIQVEGTTDDAVVFRGEDKIAGSWRGIYIDSPNRKNRIDNAVIEHAGGGSFSSNGDEGAIILRSNTYLELTNSHISNSATYGLNAVYGNDDLILENNSITLSAAPMLIAGSYASSIEGGTYVGNDLDAILVEADQITGQHTWRNLGVPFHFPNGMQVIPGGDLSIDPGTVLRFGQDSRLHINEGASGPKPSLVAVGTATQPIVFSSIDNSTSAWRGIYFDSPSSKNEIGFATIENATNNNQDGAVETWYHTSLFIHDVLFRNIENCAVFKYIFTSEDDGIEASTLMYENVTSPICQN